MPLVWLLFHFGATKSRLVTGSSLLDDFIYLPCAEAYEYQRNKNKPINKCQLVDWLETDRKIMILTILNFANFIQLDLLCHNE